MYARPDTLSDTLRVLDLGRDVDYAAAMARQEALATARRSGDSATDCLLLLEHAPVFTLGRNADPAHVLFDDAVRAARGIGLEQTPRGGDVTYHGPGQLVGYLVFRIGPEPQRILPFVGAVEDALVLAAAALGLIAGRDRRNRGVWIGNAKLAALGVRVSGGVTTHGFALNVATDLSAYAGIVPCGLRDATVTSLAEQLPATPSMERVKAVVVRAVAHVFGFREVVSAEDPAP